MSEYEQQAAQFLEMCGVTFTARCIGSRACWDDEKEGVQRDVYAITLTRTSTGETLTLDNYGQSLARSEWYRDGIVACSADHVSADTLARYPSMVKREANDVRRSVKGNNWPANVRKYLAGKGIEPKPPTAYDALAGLTHYDPGSFADWCAEMGYDTDSRRAHDTWTAIADEWYRVRAFFNLPGELEALQGIN